MGKIMVTFQEPGGAPDLQSVKARYGLADDEVDDQFGVVEVDSRDGTYTILVDEQAASKVRGTIGGGEEPITYSNPRIAPFGPPESADDNE